MSAPPAPRTRAMSLLPEPVRARLRALPQWSAVGIMQPQSLIEARLRVGAHTQLIDERLVVASLQPLTLALALEAASSVVQSSRVVELQMVDRDAQRTVGTLRLERIEPPAAGLELLFFKVQHGEDQCLGPLHRRWNRWLQARAMRRSAQSGHFMMPPHAVYQLMMYYLWPRPVVSVSVQHEAHRNLFPMDLIGPAGGDRFTLALRCSSSSVKALRESRRVALADLPAEQVRIAHALGARHARSLADWADAPLPLLPSPRFGLPVPACALRVRELEILDTHALGSHQLFITRVLNEVRWHAGPQLCHTPGFYQRFRAQIGLPLPAASSR